METRFAVVIGLDVGKTGHHACALDPGGSRLFDKPLPQDEAQLRELFTELARLLKVPPPRLSLPGWLSEPLGRSVEQAYRVTAAEPPLTRYRGALMRRDVHLSLAAAAEELGYRPAVPWQEGLARTVAALGLRD